MILLSDLLTAMGPAGGRVLGRSAATHFEGFAYDSRKLRPGEIFLAVRTARADGHDFIEDAVRRGAAAVVGDRLSETSAWPSVTVIAVDDILHALRAWARFALALYAPRVIAILGPVGKTTAAKLTVAALGQGIAEDPSVFDADNHNTLYGLSIALGRLGPSHQVAVLELAGDGPGDLVALAELTAPSIVAIVGAFDDPGRNAELGDVAARVPARGRVILNADAPNLRDLADGWSQRLASTPRWYGCSPGAAVRADAVQFNLHHTKLELTYGAETAAVRLPLLGAPGVSGTLAATAIGLEYGLSLGEIAANIERVQPLAGRLRSLAGKEAGLILDDSFDAGPPSLDAGLNLLSWSAGRKTVVLGELTISDPDASAECHRQAGMAIAGRVDRLITIGPGAEPAALAAQSLHLSHLEVVTTDSASDASQAALAGVRGGDVTLVIGGAEARLERVVERLIGEPFVASEVLVRQDAGWKQRVFLSRERPTWVEVDLAAIGDNVGRLKQIAAPAAFMAVLKADAYGHGAVRVARTALFNGADYLATACLSEAIALRRHGIAAPIFILGYTPPWQAQEIVRYGLTATAFSLEPLRHLDRAARATGGGPAKVHLKIDTGMGRLGVLPAEALDFVAAARAFEGIEVEGIYTHFATADSADETAARKQIARFNAVLEVVTRHGWQPRYVHAANSAAILRFPEAHYSMVRSGMAMYGLDPSEATHCPEGFRPALTFKTLVAQVKDLPAGSPISYGGTFVTSRSSRIAVLPVGYGDGFRRSPANWGEVLVRGQRAPIVGVVCMDMCMIDVTDVSGARAGDEVVLIGRQGREETTVSAVARRLGTIPYEVITQILARVPREVPPGA